jgi:protein SCO1/2
MNELPLPKAPQTPIDESPTNESPTDETPKAQAIQRVLWGVLIVAILFLVVLGTLKNRPIAAPQQPLLVIAEVPDFKLTHRDGSTIDLNHFRGRPWVADFIFTRCVAICPRMSYQMKRVAESLGPSTNVQIASFTVDPEHDTPAVLDEYAQRYNAGKNWYFLTGDREAIHALAIEGFLLGVDTDPDPAISNGIDPIIHSNRFVLVDAEARIRGYYDPFEEGEVERLLADLDRVGLGG